MHPATHHPIRRMTPARLWRLTRVACSKGVALLDDSASGDSFATSTSAPHVVHRLTEGGCVCQGIAYAGRCTHHSMPLEELGWLPDAAPSPTCVISLGSELDPEYAGHAHAGRTFLCPCRTRGSTGVSPVGVVIHNRPASWKIQGRSLRPLLPEHL